VDGAAAAPAATSRKKRATHADAFVKEALKGKK